MTSGAAADYVLQSDAAGNATWVDPATLPVSINEVDPQVASSATNMVPKWDGSSLVDGVITDDGTNVGIGTNSPAAKLDVAGGDALINGVRVGLGSGDINTNTAVGLLSLNANTSGVGNSAFGRDALRLNTTGANNTASGYGSLYQNGSGSDNTATGANAGRNNTTGSSNTIYGSQALQYNTVGSENTAAGRQALYFNTSGVRNSASGAYSMSQNTTGGNNVANGYQALNSTTTGSNNTANGYQALLGNNSGSSNSAFGFQADVASGALTNATAIGANALVSASNSLVLVNNANVGIGTSAPRGLLDVDGSGTIYFSTARDYNITISGGDAIQAVRDNGNATPIYLQYNNNANTILNYNSTGNVGIGTNGPLEKLSINGDASIRTGAGTGNSRGSYRIGTNNGSYSGNWCGMDSYNTGGDDQGDLRFYTAYRSQQLRMRITEFGRVGIGTTYPGGLFELGLDEGRKPGTSTWTITSDERLKNIEGDYTKGLNDILQLNPIRYHYKNGMSRTFDPSVLATENVGLTAQAVQKLSPKR